MSAMLQGEVSTPARSLLHVVAAADNFPSHDGPYPTIHPSTKEQYVPFHLTHADYRSGLTPVGLLRPQVVERLVLDRESREEDSAFQIQFSAREAATPREAAAGHQHQKSAGGNAEPDIDEDGDNVMVSDLVAECVWLADSVVAGGRDGMSRAMQSTADRWRKEGRFEGPLAGWRNEHYMIYCDPRSSALGEHGSTKPFANAAFELERAACAVFGLATFGVHMTAYEGEGEHMKIWVPRRSATKATTSWPSRLDNSVAGGIPAGMKPLESMIKECDEEASLPEEFVRSRLVSTGAVTYFYITDDGYLQPELEYIYDLKIPSESEPDFIRPRPHDDEVESFSLMGVAEVIERMHAGEFKPNCGAILVDFLMRHGFLTPENEPSFFEMKWRLTRRLGVAVPAVAA